MANPSHLKWSPELRTKARELAETCESFAIAAQRMGEIIGREVSLQSFKGAIHYETVQARQNARRLAERAEVKIAHVNRACMNACGRAMISTGPHHRLCDPCRASMSSLPEQYA